MAFTIVPFRFFRGLAQNNNKAWFEAHRAEYEREVREPMRQLIDDMNARFTCKVAALPVVHRRPSPYQCRGRGCPASDDSGEGFAALLPLVRWLNGALGFLTG